MSTLPINRLLVFSRELQRASTLGELLATTRLEIASTIGYQHAWLGLAEREEFDEVRLVTVSGDIEEAAWELMPVMKVKGDAMLEELIRGDAPVVVDDARTDPRTDKAMV